MNIKERFNNLKSDALFQFEISKWIFDNKKYGFAYIALAESILTAICENKNIDSKLYHNREFAKYLITTSKGKKINDRFKSDGRNNAKVEIPLLVKTFEKYSKEYQVLYSIINEIRNTIAHQLEGVNKNRKICDLLNLKECNAKPLSPSETIKLLPVFYNQMNDLIK